MNTQMSIAIGSDHKGVELKEVVVKILRGWGYDVTDVGPCSTESCNYAEYANAVCKRIADGRTDRGILICYTGLGMTIAANRWKGVRATLCAKPEVAELSRRHNDSNVLCLGASAVTAEAVEGILKAWLDTEFEGGRHVDRLTVGSGSRLSVTDPQLAAIIEEEHERQLNNIELIASENFTSPAVMEAQEAA